MYRCGVGIHIRISCVIILMFIHRGLCDVRLIRVKPPGTTPHIQEIFLGRCWNLQHVTRPELFVNSPRNCSELWKKFAEAFSYKDPCDVTAEDYRMFAETAQHDFPRNESLFWEKLYPFANVFSSSGKRYNTVAGTMLGYLTTDSLLWCGQLEYPGINYDTCPTVSECDSANGHHAVNEYWLMASKVFSEQIIDGFFVMMNGSDMLPYDPESILATRELVNLTPEKGVTSMGIMVIHDIGSVVYESCGEGSILQLQIDAEAQGLTVTCENNPAQVRLFQCVDSPISPECELSVSNSWSLHQESLPAYVLAITCLHITMLRS